MNNQSTRHTEPLKRIGSQLTVSAEWLGALTLDDIADTIDVISLVTDHPNDDIAEIITVMLRRRITSQLLRDSNSIWSQVYDDPNTVVMQALLVRQALAEIKYSTEYRGAMKRIFLDFYGRFCGSRGGFNLEKFLLYISEKALCHSAQA